MKTLKQINTKLYGLGNKLKELTDLFDNQKLRRK